MSGLKSDSCENRVHDLEQAEDLSLWGAFSAPQSIEVVRQQDYIQCGLLNMKNKYETRERTQMGYQSGAKALGLERLIATSAIRILWTLEVS